MMVMVDDRPPNVSVTHPGPTVVGSRVIVTVVVVLGVGVNTGIDGKVSVAGVGMTGIDITDSVKSGGAGGGGF